MTLARIRGPALVPIAILVACGSDGLGFGDGLDGGPLERAEAGGSTPPDAGRSSASDGGPTQADGSAAQDASSDASPLNDDAFDPSACGGIPLKGTELLARIGSTAKPLGSTVVQYRSRECASIGVGCGPFYENESWVHRINSSGQSTSTVVAGQLTVFPWPSPATAAQIFLGGPSYPGSPLPVIGMTDNMTCAVSESAAVSCGEFAIVFSTHGPSPVGGTLRFRYGSSSLRLTGKITASCLQLFAKGGGVAPPGGPATGGAYVDEEVAVLHRWSPPL